MNRLLGIFQLIFHSRYKHVNRVFTIKSLICSDAVRSVSDYRLRTNPNSALNLPSLHLLTLIFSPHRFTLANAHSSHVSYLAQT